MDMNSKLAAIRDRCLQNGDTVVLQDFFKKLRSESFNPFHITVDELTLPPKGS
jgi:hypothetical protein